MLTYILFVVGFVLLIKGADWLVDGASSIAKKYRVSDIVIGLTIVSFGTSMPELIVNILASLNGSAELAVGNVFGSNIANILLILGVAALIYPLPLQRGTVMSEIPFSLMAALLVGFLANAALFDKPLGLSISRADGAILLFFFVLFMLYVFKVSREGGEETVESYEEKPMLKAGGLILLGIVALFLGGKWTVDGAIHIATQLGMSESFIGLTVVAIGTSLPELVTSAVAAKRRNTDIAVGNAVGSNIFNILWILGISALIHPLPFNVLSNFDILMIIFASTLLILSVSLEKKKAVGRFSGVLFLLCYIAYIVFLLQRG
ncbi:cation:H+ antiporter [Catalinimonas alkaloidigena]|uniref:calcium/sodium antiporter n=1 Tax=Catalinimonas alkaloidigena TaxID=1075417 RepID=UPI002405C175|nr:calcium/sodium antiporter [Catalinimonas alkaloidigena]MDF9800153.1 cation:H+ antiporter [Catalinimonas alkaloidigena]